MPRYFLALATALLPLATLAQTKPAAPSTTPLESQLTAEICQDFDKLNAAKPFAQLSKEEAMSTLQQSMTQVAMNHPQEIEQLMKASGADAQSAMQAMGQRVASQLAADCPVAMTLFARLAGTDPATAQAPDITVSEAERPLLTKLATDICTDLTAQDAKKPLLKMPKADRMAMVQKTMERQIKAHATELTQQYGPTFLQDMPRITAMGAKVGGLMAKQCPTQTAAFTIQP
ncbi:hypothetical protein [Hymenobacter jeollabukensis]|uniref:DUF4142 domain-containing protein n=1 Tax=Hymenobacter jeollabukensis TaxID=2025313 RepID=A0A5R8WS26_9BACT|nr:hypothetical protein [Hymenobacter jeollabukensis]TLM93994.1 hypothetical protein FDY95_08145 [Hymenobacter jeollabukensis]